MNPENPPRRLNLHYLAELTDYQSHNAQIIPVIASYCQQHKSVYYLSFDALQERSNSFVH